MDNISEKEVFLNLNTIFKYLNATPSSRCVVEGEEVLNAKHLLLCGITSAENWVFNIFALCLQTSALSQGKPHEISGKLNVNNGNVEIKPFRCTCKAGMSGTCKHVSATLLKCARWYIVDIKKYGISAFAI